MQRTPQSRSVSSRGRPGFRAGLAGLLCGVAALWGGSALAAQDPVSGRWFATMEDPGGPARAVLVLEARGETIRGRLTLRGSTGLEIQGRRDGQRVHRWWPWRSKPRRFRVA